MKRFITKKKKTPKFIILLEWSINILLLRSINGNKVLVQQVFINFSIFQSLILLWKIKTVLNFFIAILKVKRFIKAFKGICVFTTGFSLVIINSLTLQSQNNLTWRVFQKCETWNNETKSILLLISSSLWIFLRRNRYQ